MLLYLVPPRPDGNELAAEQDSDSSGGVEDEPTGLV